MAARRPATQRRDATSTSDTPRKRLPLSLSLIEDPERLERMWAMTPQQRIAAARQGQLSLGEMLRWAARRPREVPLLDGEFFFITDKLADYDEHEPARPRDAR